MNINGDNENYDFMKDNKAKEDIIHATAWISCVNIQFLLKQNTKKNKILNQHINADTIHREYDGNHVNIIMNDYILTVEHKMNDQPLDENMIMKASLIISRKNHDGSLTELAQFNKDDYRTFYPLRFNDPGNLTNFTKPIADKTIEIITADIENH